MMLRKVCEKCIWWCAFNRGHIKFITQNRYLYLCVLRERVCDHAIATVRVCTWSARTHQVSEETLGQRIQGLLMHALHCVHWHMVIKADLSASACRRLVKRCELAKHSTFLFLGRRVYFHVDEFAFYKC
jgi:hypothetical protein